MFFESYDLSGRGKPTKKLLDLIESDLRTAYACVSGAEDHVKWRFRTRVADPKYSSSWKKGKGEEEWFIPFKMYQQNSIFLSNTSTSLLNIII